jgi:hypothetical protein
LRETAAIPPDDFEIPHDLAERLVSIYENPLAYREIAWQDGVDFISGYLDTMSESNELYVKLNSR